MAQGVDRCAILQGDAGDDGGLAGGHVSRRAGLASIQEYLGHAAVHVAADAGGVFDAAVAEGDHLMAATIWKAGPPRRS